MSVKIQLYYKTKLHYTEIFPSKADAVQHGENWKNKTKGNLYKITPLEEYKIAKSEKDIPYNGEYFINRIDAINKKEIMKKLKIDGYKYHIFAKTPDNEKWWALD